MIAMAATLVFSYSWSPHIIWFSVKGTPPSAAKNNASFLPYERPSPRDGGHHQDMENDRWSLYAYEDALLPGHDPV